MIANNRIVEWPVPNDITLVTVRGFKRELLQYYVSEHSFTPASYDCMESIMAAKERMIESLKQEDTWSSITVTYDEQSLERSLPWDEKKSTIEAKRLI